MKKLLALFLSLALIFAVIPAGIFSVSAETQPTSGTTSECTWILNGTELTVSGNGRMGDYSYISLPPWGRSITKVTISNGVTYIGSSAFDCCYELNTVTIGNEVKSIGDSAFRYCSGLTNIEIPNSVTQICYRVFSSCNSLKKVSLPKTLNNIEASAFESCGALTDVYYEGNRNDWNQINLNTEVNESLLNANIHFKGASEKTLTNINGVWYCTEDGEIRWDYTGLVLYGGCYYYAQNGVVNFNSPPTLTNYGGGWYFTQNGAVDWNFNGTFTFRGWPYNVVNGYVVFS